MFHAEEPQILGAITQYLAVQVTWHPGFVHRRSRIFHFQ